MVTSRCHFSSAFGMVTILTHSIGIVLLRLMTAFSYDLSMLLNLFGFRAGIGMLTTMSNLFRVVMFVVASIGFIVAFVVGAM